MLRLVVGLAIVAEREELEPPVEVARDDDRALVGVLVLDGHVRPDRHGLQRCRAVAIQAGAWPGSVRAAGYRSGVEECCAQEHEVHAATGRGAKSGNPRHCSSWFPWRGRGPGRAATSSHMNTGM